MLSKKNHKVKIRVNGSIAQFLASGFGSGCAPKAPGTFGTLMAVPLWFFASYLHLYAYLLLIICMLIAGIWICDQASKELGVHDHGGIVWDEFVGFFITMIFVPVSIFNVILGFILFRLFDIVKPYPIKLLDEKVSGGFGIMIDDVLAGVFALLSLHAILYILFYLS